MTAIMVFLGQCFLTCMAYIFGTLNGPLSSTYPSFGMLFVSFFWTALTAGMCLAVGIAFSTVIATLLTGQVADCTSKPIEDFFIGKSHSEILETCEIYVLPKSIQFEVV